MDSTPEISHVDQLTIIVVRYIEDTERVERFITFLDNSGQTREEQADSLLQVLATNSISFDDCRGQSYYNADNMSGKYNGMQAILRQQNSLAMFITCSAQSLNLVCHNTVSCRSAVAFVTLYRRFMYSLQHPLRAVNVCTSVSRTKSTCTETIN